MGAKPIKNKRRQTFAILKTLSNCMIEYNIIFQMILVKNVGKEIHDII